MSHIYNSQFTQCEPDRLDELKILIGKQSNVKNILEIGTYAGYITLALSEIAQKVITVDYKEIFNPDIGEHIKLNSISNIEWAESNELESLIEDKFSDEIDLVYIHRPGHEDFIKIIKENLSNNVVVIAWDAENDKFVVEKLSKEAPKKPKKISPKKTSTDSNASVSGETSL